jgi:hypothetical protein
MGNVFFSVGMSSNASARTWQPGTLRERKGASGRCAVTSGARATSSISPDAPGSSPIRHASITRYRVLLPSRPRPHRPESLPNRSGGARGNRYERGSARRPPPHGHPRMATVQVATGSRPVSSTRSRTILPAHRLIDAHTGFEVGRRRAARGGRTEPRVKGVIPSPPGIRRWPSSPEASLGRPVDARRAFSRLATATIHDDLG